MRDIHIVVTDTIMKLKYTAMIPIAMTLIAVRAIHTRMSMELVVTIMVRASLSASNRLRRQACR